MGKVKQRTKKPYVGGRRKKAKIRSRNVGKHDTYHENEGSHAQSSVFDVEAEMTDKNSASFQKMRAFDDLREAQSEQADQGYIIVQQSVLNSLMKRLLCPVCAKPSVTFDVSDVKLGLAAKGLLSCSACRQFSEENYLCERITSSDSANESFEVNIRAILAFRGIGCGYEAMKQWLALMNMPYNPSQNVYQKNLKKIELAAGETFSRISERTHNIIRNAYEEIGMTPNKDGVLDIAVSFDGSWQKRGYSSHNGMASVIDLITGYPIDYEVLSNYCSKCKIAEDKQLDTQEWKEKHAPHCQKNFSGSAGAMEVECAKRLWSRSIEMHNFRYTTVLCDGDSKAYDAVKTLRVYGENCEIQKEDCVNHVAKRMGTALRKIVEVSKAQGKTISGKGKLTKPKIAKIQNYYGRAIKENCSDVELCRKRVMAILLHLSSTDKAPKHNHCPPGPSSWCFYQRCLAKQEEPGSHSDHETIPVEIGKQLVPIFQRLSDSDLLQRCTRNKTQNPNESFHNVIWKICPKSTYVGKRTILTAVTLAACQFTMGCSFTNILCTVLKMEPGKNMVFLNKKRDIKRIRRAEVAESVKSKKRRKELKYNKTIKESTLATTEGESYAAGQFNG